MARFFQVGGSVRDKLLGVKSKDIDYAVECESFDAMREAILAKGGKIFVETPQYFTIRANVPVLGATDYVLCRKDGAYSDGRRPDSVEVGTIFDDLARRDFTVNAIAIDTETGALIDPHGGAQDLTARVLRCVGNPVDRFNEDRLRIFRAARFSLTKGLTVHLDTFFAIADITL
jgi:tRNA nucleotidyltransferase (CCA-adding enzyme)